MTHYQFVVDGNWCTDSSAPLEKDKQGNENNVLHPESIEKTTMSGVTPESTTAQMAGSVPLEEKKPTEVVAEKADEVKEEAQKAAEDTKPEVAGKVDETTKQVEEATETKPTENVGSTEGAPTPLVPGNFPSTPANELDKPVSINPLPAADNAVNPITLAPGEPIPDSVNTEDINKNVKLDKESYEKADALPGEAVAATSNLPPVSGNMIPESSLPVAEANDAHISTVTPTATTVALAADAPIETKKDAEVPSIVKESQEKAQAEPEASAVTEEVQEKAAVESELLEKVPEASSTAEGTGGKGTDKKEGETTTAEAAAAVAGAAVAVGGAAFAAAVAAKDAVVEKATEAATGAPESVKDKLPESVKEAVDAKATEAIRKEISPEVPAEVKESLVEAAKGPEAAASTEAVTDKKDVEAELLQKVKPTEPAAPKEETKPAEEPKAEEAKPTEEITKLANKADDAAANGDAASESGAGPSTTASETPAARKKKNRFSAMISKLRGKVGSKH